ncbi:hypothetical protein LZ496_00660 [Sphingomonas sp. NSE70-1]|uniref:SGNH/GDSL hydrolase family protein n=1 Tax=Sphingomonas caseinilyticus TaxID=2908205 RepID=A0ABT0RQK5_9SPHN|nr:hypothetical protein [Sphingomonas caseinilyticus]MCL6697302.1 hypothetical protein [Sphingomonas caseinilyticus]
MRLLQMQRLAGLNLIGKRQFVADYQMLLYGDSHSEAVFQAAELRERRRYPTSIAIHRARRQKGEKVIGDTSLEEFVEIARGLSSSDMVISMIGGNQHAVLATIQHPIPFDVLEPGADFSSLRPGTELIPYRAIASIIHGGIRGRDGRALSKIRDATPARMFHIIPPPPKRDSDFIRSYHESRFSEDIAKLGVSSPELRMKIWRMQRNLLHEYCDELGIEAFDPPQAALDQDGFLLPEYYAKDATHANRNYGLLLLQELEQRIVRSNESVQ